MKVFLGSLKPGDTFKIGNPGEEMFGVVLVQRYGYSQVRISKGLQHVDVGEGFDTLAGRTQEWSPNSRVTPIKEEKKMGAVGEVVKKLRADAEKKIANGEKVKGKLGAPARAEAKRKATVVKKTMAINLCKCGCGGQTRREFCPGHDARYYGWIRKFCDGRMKWDELPDHVRKEFKTTKAIKAFWEKRSH